MWKQICQIQTVIVVIFRYSCKHIGEPLPGIHITGFAAAKKRIHNGCIFSCIMIATEQKVLSSVNGK